MGLDAVVYVNKSNLALNQEDDPFQMDEETGEVYLKNPKLSNKYPADMFTAVHKRLGNASMIAAIADEVSPVTNGDSILSNKVLYSGSHSGDRIGLEDLGRLESEINLVRERTIDTRSADLESFLDILSELVEAAKKQGNPIVFV